MRHLLKILMLTTFICGQLVAAQEETPPPNFKAVIERCITKPTEPSDQWSFDGTIITYHMGDGIHGFRADTPSRYYISFDNDTGSLLTSAEWSAPIQCCLITTTLSLIFE
jgi:hypothetical protein